MLAIIGGSGLDVLASLKHLSQESVATPFGQVQLTRGDLNQKPIIFLPRHGANHQVAPHNINYRANCWALSNAGVTTVLACNVVGGIGSLNAPNTIAIPRQIIDYTWGREHTYYDGQHYPGLPLLDHVDFCEPLTSVLVDQIEAGLIEEGIPFVGDDVYGCTQGPRLETVAEISRLQADGCSIVGMTAMPEASLARELGLDYAMISYVVNWAAGAGPNHSTLPSPPSMEAILHNISQGGQKTSFILEKLVVILNI